MIINLYFLLIKKDSFLIGSPPGAFRRNLAMALCELTQREAEYLCLTRDTTGNNPKLLIFNFFKNVLIQQRPISNKEEKLYHLLFYMPINVQ
jgi:hypothetical protein